MKILYCLESMHFIFELLLILMSFILFIMIVMMIQALNEHISFKPLMRKDKSRINIKINNMIQ